MVSNVQTYSQGGAGYNQLTAEQAEFYQRTMLERLIDNVVFMNYGSKKNIPKRAGATTSFRRMELPNLSTTAIVEGTTPDALDLTINKLSATVKQYGAWTKVSDFLDLTGLDPVITETSQMFGDHAGLSMDQIVRDIVAAGTNVKYANGKTARNLVAAGDKISAADLIKLRTIMVKNNVKQIKLPSGGKGYVAFTHPEVVANIMQLQEWKDQNTYVDVKNREQGIAGQMYGIYFLEATTAPVFAGAGASGADVYGTIVIGEGAYGIPDVQGSSKPEIIVKNSNGDSHDTSNPMNLYSTIAWKSAFTAVRLQEKAILRYESAIS
ncbi:N4-gp56 family major capsid protein [Bacillus sp. FJAT-49736]|uniref:N4-gp56 family major capsid protein n=1 Tax=Bacillus sp. FJAT-49736 TaxID=2833582 RepID=UPI001BC96577|nr:N4-gp56 family major capsid protein [Bacillus sp. FJAT-49736]MBS4173474.1 N4-gp56 family major capsid protein [Bacillus sp. FJAT-49736]